MSKRSATSSLVREINNKIVFNKLLLLKKASATEIAKLCDISYPTSLKILESACDKSIIVKKDGDVSTGGRKPVLFSLNKDYQYSLSIYIEYSTIYTILRDYVGNVIEKSSFVIDESNIIEEIDKCIDNFVIKYDKINIVAMALPCTIIDGKIVSYYDNPKYVGINVKEKFVDKYNINIIVENNMKTVAQANSNIANKHKIISCIRIDDRTFATSFLIHNKILNGANGFSGEVVYMPKFADEANYFNKNIDFIKTVISIINPDECILFLLNYDLSEKEITEELKKTLPDILIPKITIRYDYKLTVFEGLKKSIVKKQSNDFKKLI